MRVLLTNDDGIEAAGLVALEAALLQAGAEVLVAAPDRERSAASHSMSLGQTLKIYSRGKDRYAITGTPVDDVHIAVKHLFRDRLPDLVLSGINRGANMGCDVNYSGTVAGAREAVLLGLPAIAVSVELTGEEAQLILRDGAAAVAIGADRQAARWKLASGSGFSPDLYILDDGFQHWRTRRELDLVLIDAIDPFRGGVFPKGRLREPLRALSRASAVIITRAEQGREYTGLIDRIRRENPSCPIFKAWFAADPPQLPPDVRPGAFCGIAQPESFRRTLAWLGIEPAFLKTFPDHHHYTESEIRPLLDQAPLLLTTEKDLLNLPASLQSHPGIRAIPVRLELDRPGELLQLVLGCLSAARGSSGS